MESDSELEAGLSGPDYPLDGESESDVSIRPEKRYDDRFKEARQFIRINESLLSENDVRRFFDEFSDIAGQASAKSNLLHHLVDTVKLDRKAEDVELLVRRLVEQYPDLLKYSNQDGQNPIFVAIRAPSQVHPLVEYMISACIEKKKAYEKENNKEKAALFSECLNDALRSGTAGGKKTCLHVAFEHNLNSDMIKTMIENASDDALAAQDEVNKTPMHYAMPFPRCDDARVELIESFIKRDAQQSKSATRFLDLLDTSGYSVYREHQKSRKAEERGRQDRAKRRRRADTRIREGGETAQASDEPMRDTSRPRTSTKPPRRTAVGSTLAGRGSARDGATPGEKPGHAGDAAKEPQPDDIEAQRRKKKEEEKTARQGKTKPTVNGDSPGMTRTPSTKLDVSKASPAPRPSISTPQLERAPNTSIKRSNTARLESKQGQETVKPPSTPPAPSTQGSSNTKAKSGRTRNSDKILQKLKLHYMRTRDPEKVLSFLYGKNMDDVQITFDYNTLPSRVKLNDFMERFGKDKKSGLKFDSVLKYVSFPHVDVHVTVRRARLDSGTNSQPGELGREDMLHFFNWLYQKGVRHIIRLSVKDLGGPDEKVHSDQCIQKCLERFVIEDLDWQKTDLDPETIFHVSSKAGESESPDRQLEHLVLRWSGSNIALRAWSEPEGLPMLPRLKRITLLKPPPGKTHDNEEWIAARIEKFKERLNASRKTVRSRQSAVKETRAVSAANSHVFDTPADPDFPDIEVKDNLAPIEASCGNTPDPHTHRPGEEPNLHKWLESTEKFGQEMAPFWTKTLESFKSKNSATLERVEEDVVIALIDDGVDVFDKSLIYRQILEGKSFEFRHGEFRPPFSSAEGHGTLMASMILRVCPMAKIYPIRLKTYDIPGGKSRIDAEYAAHAIQAALDKKATIISMSWTIPMMDSKDKRKSRNSTANLHKVLQKAVDNKVLMFCSPPDQGKFKSSDYPSGPWRKDFFRIAAAGPDGNVFRWADEDGITCVVPGVDVRTQGGRNTSSNTETGSSIATALAAGLAAMIIYCVKASIMTIKTENKGTDFKLGAAIQDNHAKMITDPETMKHAFKSLGQVTKNNFIQVWDELDSVRWALKSLNNCSTDEEKQQYFQRFVDFGSKLANQQSHSYT